MRLVSYESDGAWRAGVLVDGVVVDAAKAAGTASLDGNAWSSVKEIIALDEDAQARLQKAAVEHAEELGVSRDQVRLGPPIPDADKILCIGLNYQSHFDEAQNVDGAPRELPTIPLVFSKFRTALVGDRGEVQMAVGDDNIDYEAELAVVIGRRARAVSEDDALAYVAGYMPFNDVSARHLQLRSPQWTMGKAFDTSGPCGPALVTKDEAGDVSNLAISGSLNGETVQEGSTSEMLFSIGKLIEYISSEITLMPGDIIATGTPAGVGAARDPKLWMKAGDVFEVSIEGLGTLTNTIVGPFIAGSDASQLEVATA